MTGGPVTAYSIELAVLVISCVRDRLVDWPAVAGA